MTPLTRIAAAIRSQIQCGEDDAMRAARAAVEALLPASKEMVEQGSWTPLGASDMDDMRDYAASCFAAMIGKVLEE